MKKLTKSMLTLIIVLSLLFAMAITVFAARWIDGGEFENVTGKGSFTATLEVTETSASAKFGVSDFFGLENYDKKAEIKGRAYDERGKYYDLDTFSYTSSCGETVKPDPGQTFAYAKCEYYHGNSDNREQQTKRELIIFRPSGCPQRVHREGKA